MNFDHFFHTATLLANGTVLIAGGHYLTANGGGASPSEVYDPATDTVVLTGPMVTPRNSHTATRLADGTVLVAGGNDVSGTSLVGAEIYDPATATFAATGSFATARYQHTATLLADGRVLVAGGLDVCAVGCGEEIYDPVVHLFVATPRMSTARVAHSGASLTNGSVLIVGGASSTGNTGTAEAFDPLAKTFIAAGSLVTPRWRHTETRLSDGTVLIAGGYNTTYLASAELYAPTPPAPTSLQITPAGVTTLVGGTQQFTVVDNLGHARDDVMWSVSDSTVATITTDSSPTLTGVAAGSVTLTASIQGVSAETLVTIVGGTSLPEGSVRWRVPAGAAGLSPMQIVPSVGSDGGPAIFAISGGGTAGLLQAPSTMKALTQAASSTSTDTLIQALTADGQQLWQHWLPAVNGNSVPDRFGGLIVTQFNTCDHVNPMTITDLDGPTGEWRWQVEAASTCTNDPPQFAMRHDGVVVIVTPGNTSGLSEVMMIEGRFGTVLAAPPIPPSSFDDVLGQTFTGYSRVGPPVIDGDGVTYLEYETRHVAYPAHVTTATLWLMKIAMDLTNTSTQLATTDTDTNLFPGRVIPDGHGGVIATWTFSPTQSPADPSPLRAAHVTAGGGVTPYDLPVQPPDVLPGPTGLPLNTLLALGENDTVFASYGSDLMSFNSMSGTIQWSYSAAPAAIAVVVADASGGVAAKVTADGIDTVVRFQRIRTNRDPSHGQRDRSSGWQPLERRLDKWNR